MEIGGPCCFSPNEPVEKQQEAVHAMLYGLVWALTADSRWTHSAHLLRRCYLCAVGPRLLPRTLSAVQVSRNAGFGLETMLSKIIAADKGDFSSRTRLRLLRCCRVLCQREAVQQTATIICYHKPVDDIVKRFLGDPRKNIPRATCRDISLPSTSPIAMARDKLVSLLQDYSPENKDWTLLALTEGAGTPSLETRQDVRREGLQLDAGLVDQMDIRFSNPPTR